MTFHISALQGVTAAIGVLSMGAHIIGIVVVSTSTGGPLTSLSIAGFTLNSMLSVLMILGALLKRPALIYPWIFFQLIFPTAMLSYLTTLHSDLSSLAFPVVFLVFTIVLLLVVAAFMVQLCHQDQGEGLAAIEIGKMASKSPLPAYEEVMVAPKKQSHCKPAIKS